MNVLKNIPYNNVKMGNRKVADTKSLLIMQIALRPGQSVPRHEANSNVHLLVIKGELAVDLDGREHRLREGDLRPVAFRTPMLISNAGPGGATFLVLKAPNPSEMPTEKSELKSGSSSRRTRPESAGTP